MSGTPLDPEDAGTYTTGDRIELEFNPANSTFHVKHKHRKLAVGSVPIELKCIGDREVVDVIEGHLPTALKYGEESEVPNRDLIDVATERVNRRCDNLEAKIVLEGGFIDGYPTR